MLSGLAILCGLAASATAAIFPAPFWRTLRVTSPALAGRDVTILQGLLQRAPSKCRLSCDRRGGCSGVYDEATAASLACTTGTSGGSFDADAARFVLKTLSSDGWHDDGSPASKSGHLYKLVIPVHRNRSVETIATLHDANHTELFRFRVRAHGHDVDAAGQPLAPRPWPDLSDQGCADAGSRQGCVGLNSFSTNGATPTECAACWCSPARAQSSRASWPSQCRWRRTLGSE